MRATRKVHKRFANLLLLKESVREEAVRCDSVGKYHNKIQDINNNDACVHHFVVAFFCKKSKRELLTTSTWNATQCVNKKTAFENLWRKTYLFRRRGANPYGAFNNCNHGKPN